MLTREDLAQISEIVSTAVDNAVAPLAFQIQELRQETRTEFKRIDGEISRIIWTMATKQDFQQLSQRMDGFEESLSEVIVAVDRLSIPLEDLRLEYAAVSTQLSRHEAWHSAPAQRLSMTLLY